MANSCAGSDASVPPDVEEVLKEHIKRTKPRQYFDKTDDGPDRKHSCVLEDLDGARCPDGTCRYSRDGKPKADYKSHKPIP